MLNLNICYVTLHICEDEVFHLTKRNVQRYVRKGGAIVSSSLLHECFVNIDRLPLHQKLELLVRVPPERLARDHIDLKGRVEGPM